MIYPFGTNRVDLTPQESTHPDEHNYLNAWMNQVVLVDGVRYAKTAAGINQALSDVAGGGGGTVLLPPGTISISTTIIHSYSGVRLLGCGAGWQTAQTLAKTILKWTGGDVGATTFIVDFGATDASLYHVADASVEGIHIWGDNKSVSGMRARSLVNCDIDINGWGCEGAYILNWDVSPGITGVEDFAGNQHNRVKGLLGNNTVVNGGGMTVLDTTGICSNNDFSDMRVYHTGSKPGIKWVNCDFNHFRNIAIQANPETCTISNGANATVGLTAHGRVAGDVVVFHTAGTLPTGLTLGKGYYVISAGLTADAFRFEETVGGGAVTTSSAGSGTFYVTSPGFYMHGIVSGSQYANGNILDGVDFGNGNLICDGFAGADQANEVRLRDTTNAYAKAANVKTGVLIGAPSGVLFKAHMSASQAIPTAAATTLVFDVEDYDNYGAYNPATGVFTCPHAGWYLITALIHVTTSTEAAGTIYEMSIFSGATRIAQVNFTTILNVGGNQPMLFSGALHIDPSNVAVAVTHNAGANRNVTEVPNGGGCFFTAINLSRD